jgi:NADH:ubiquinone oxidoreductase subunit 6 (subunit J)
MNQNGNICKLIFLAIATFALVITGLGFVRTHESVNPGFESPVLYMVFVGLAFLSLTLGWILPQRLRNGLNPVPPNGDDTLEKRYVTLFIIRFALFDFVTILGFILSTVTNDFVWVALFTAVALICMSLSFPSERFFAKWTKREI